MPSVAPIENGVPGLYEPMVETKAISFSDNGTSFLENLLDIVNPLQHIPVVSTIYRSITGDDIAPPARLIGGVLFGGPIGFASATASLFFEEASGGDLASHALALLNDSDETPELASSEGPPGLVNSLAAETAPQPPLAVATNVAVTDNAADIIWNGPRVLPSLAHTTATAPSSETTEPSLDVADANPRPVDFARAERGGPDARPNTASVTSNLAARPVWLDAAIADAQSVQDTAQLGQAPPKVEGQPWITDAILGALGKYQALTLERNR